MAKELAEVLNRDCFCIAVNRQALHDSLKRHLRSSGLPQTLLDANNHLFADSPVFLGQEHLREMQRLIRAVENVASIGEYRDAVFAAVPASTGQDFGPRGVFFAYDFHLGPDGPQLIEVNSNAGGVLLNLYLASAQQACCDAVTTFFGRSKSFADAEHELVAMFNEEWSSQRPGQPLRTIAIVDKEPSAQFLYPEFLLFQSLFKRHDIEAIVADPEDFTIRQNALWSDGIKVDLVYNRLTDFYLEEPEAACLRTAYQQGIAVFTPSPYLYGLYADKRNLPLLSDSERLRELGIEEEVITTLTRSLPATVAVTKDNAAHLWANRKHLFFKPATGHGSRGAYRGAKLTKRVWQDITHADYVAQAIVPPSERQLIIHGQKQSLKLDIRCVTYGGEIQQLSARLYQGQTTNLRTEGGGLATVFSTPDLCCT